MKFSFLDEQDQPVEELEGVGDTPREAFEGCVQRFIHLNNNEESPTLAYLLPLLREFFNEDGGVKLEYFL